MPPWHVGRAFQAWRRTYAGFEDGLGGSNEVFKNRGSISVAAKDHAPKPAATCVEPVVINS